MTYSTPNGTEIFEIVRVSAERTLRHYGCFVEFRDRGHFEDLVSDVVVWLYSDNRKRIAEWVPQSGSAEAYFGVLTRRFVIDVLRSRRRNPHTECPTVLDDLEIILPLTPCPHAQYVIEETLRRVTNRVKCSGTSRDWKVFVWCFVEEKDNAQIAKDLGIKPTTLHQVRCRLRAKIADIEQEEA